MQKKNMFPTLEFHLTMNMQLGITIAVHKCNELLYKQLGCKIEKNEGNKLLLFAP